MRCFIAIDLPNELKEYLRPIQKSIKEKKLANMTLARDFHITLKFFENIEESKVEMIKKQLANVKFPPFNVYLDGTGVFPDEKRPRVVWVGAEPKDKICELQTKIDVEMFKLGFQMEKDFKPHITLARLKFTPEATRKAFINQVDSIKIERKSFRFESVKFIKSTLLPEGPKYEEL